MTEIKYIEEPEDGFREIDGSGSAESRESAESADIRQEKHHENEPEAEPKRKRKKTFSAGSQQTARRPREKADRTSLGALALGISAVVVAAVCLLVLPFRSTAVSESERHEDVSSMLPVTLAGAGLGTESIDTEREGSGHRTDGGAGGAVTVSEHTVTDAVWADALFESVQSLQERAEKISAASQKDQPQDQLSDQASSSKSAEAQALRTSVREAVQSAEEVGYDGVQTISDNRRMSYNDYLTLLQIVEAEATGGDETSKLLIANVVLNRVEDDHFPDTVYEVVWQRLNGHAQFSPTQDGRMGTLAISETAQNAVKRALEGEDNSQGALFFIAKSSAAQVNIEWFDTNLVYLFSYGGHDFYRFPTDEEKEAAENGGETEPEDAEEHSSRSRTAGAGQSNENSTEKSTEKSTETAVL